MKKVITTVIVASMVATSCLSVLPAYAASMTYVNSGESSASVTAPKQLTEQVLAKVKDKLNISDTYKEFTSDSMNYGGKLLYSLEWANDDGDTYEYIHVTADEYGNIINYSAYNSKWRSRDGDIKIPKVSRTEAKETAQSFIEQVLPEKVEKLVYVEQNNSYAGSDSYSFRFARQENGIEVYNNYVNVTIKIINDMPVATDLNSNWTDGEFPKLTDSIGAEQAKEAYRKEFGFELRYRKSYQDKKMYLEYGLKENGFINAENGKKAEQDMTDTAVFASGGSMMEQASKDMKQSADNRKLSEAEIKELSSVAGLISIDRLEEMARNIEELKITQEQKLNSYRIYKAEDEYYAMLSFDGGEDKGNTNVTFDAQSGEIRNANVYVMPIVKAVESTSVKKLTDEQKADARAKADAFLEEYAPTRFAQTKFVSEHEYDGNVVFQYVNIINGVPFYDNYISITWNAEENQLSSMYTQWQNTENAPSADDVIDIDEAYDTIIANSDFKQVYIISDKKAVLAYTVGNSMQINAQTGKMIDRWGREYVAATGSYTDISGHWAEGMIKTLAEYNIVVAGNEFKPDEAITQKTYFELLYRIMYGKGSADEDMIYNTMISRNVIDQSEKAPGSAVTKEQAVVYLLRIMDYRKAAEISGIYICDFADADAITIDNIGYVAIAKGLGIVKGGENNEFMPDKELTRAEAASMIYNYLTK